MRNEKELRSKLEEYTDRDRKVGRIAKKGLNYANYFDGAEKRDVLRHYIKKAKESDDPRARINIEYEGKVLDSTSFNRSVQGYTIVDCTSIEVERIDAGLVDVTSVEADTVSCTVLDGTSVVANTLDTQVSNYTSHKTLEEKKKENKREGDRREKTQLSRNLRKLKTSSKIKRRKKLLERCLKTQVQRNRKK